MLNSLLYIVWNNDPEMFTIPGINWPVRWYGLLFAVAFVGSQVVMNRIYKTENRPQKHLDILTLYIILGTVIGVNTSPEERPSGDRVLTAERHGLTVTRL